MKKKSKKIILIIIALIIVLSLLLCFFYQDIIIYYFKLSGREKETCSMARTYFNAYLSSLNETYSNCSYVKEKYNLSITTDDNSSCDFNKISNDLENPASLSQWKAVVYTNLAVSKMLIFGTDYLNQTLNSCDIETSLSVVLFEASYMTSAVITATSEQARVRACFDYNLTKNESEDCIVNLMDAEKSSLNDTRFVADINITSCSEIIPEATKNSLDKNSFSIISPSLAKIICQNMDTYSKGIRNKAMDSNLNYLEKYAILSSLLTQNKILGKIGTDKANKQILIDNMKNTRYKNLFENLS